MGDGEAVAGRSVEAEQPGSVIGGALVGVVLFVVLLFLGTPTMADVVATLVASAFYAVVWGVTTGFYLRRQWARLPTPRLAHHVREPRLPAMLHGGLVAAAAGAATAACTGVMVWLFRDGQDLSDLRVLLSLLPGGSFGLAISVAIGAGELQRWQDRHGVRLHTRVGAPRLAWTRAQARQRLVGVPLLEEAQQLHR